LLLAGEVVNSAGKIATVNDYCDWQIFYRKIDCSHTKKPWIAQKSAIHGFGVSHNFSTMKNR